jgi:hypothetical protein
LQMLKMLQLQLREKLQMLKMLQLQLPEICNYTGLR